MGFNETIYMKLNTVWQISIFVSINLVDSVIGRQRFLNPECLRPSPRLDESPKAVGEGCGGDVRDKEAKENDCIPESVKSSKTEDPRWWYLQPSNGILHGWGQENRSLPSDCWSRMERGR